MNGIIWKGQISESAKIRLRIGLIFIEISF